MLLFFFHKIFALIPVNENVEITLAEFPEWQLSVDQNIPLLRNFKEKARIEEDINLAKIFEIGKKYQIDYNGVTLFRGVHDEEVKGKYFDMADSGFYFQIFATENGQIIKSFEQCIGKGKWNDVLKGYTLIAKECDNSTWQSWEIKRVPMIIKDNNELNAHVFIHNRDFVPHKSDLDLD